MLAMGCEAHIFWGGGDLQAVSTLWPTKACSTFCQHVPTLRYWAEGRESCFFFFFLVHTLRDLQTWLQDGGHQQQSLKIQHATPSHNNNLKINSHTFWNAHGEGEGADWQHECFVCMLYIYLLNVGDTSQSWGMPEAHISFFVFGPREGKPTSWGFKSEGWEIHNQKID